jgi:hypothetical protein
MAASIRVHRVYMLKDPVREVAVVEWEGPHGRRDGTFRDGWGLKLAKLLKKNDEIYVRAVEGEIDVAGILDWDAWELNSIFTLDPESGRDTADVLALLIHES